MDLLIHCWVYEQDEGVWSPAHRVARLTGAHHCMAFGLLQQSNSGATAIETALHRITTDPRTTTVLITTADKTMQVVFAESLQPGEQTSPCSPQLAVQLRFEISHPTGGRSEIGIKVIATSFHASDRLSIVQPVDLPEPRRWSRTDAGPEKRWRQREPTPGST
ncbi:hypothetical protein [Streptomyces sp. NBC_00690]|uniref:hypothetical protein n=1 Tax=Streptomyces sp. NBC_00690 TaxID=2975808 RepID=UPI002E2A86B6|nr:hypothetical protein [Streptomyces sp. NBC_00690]